MVGRASLPRSAELWAGLAVLLGPPAGPPSGGMQAGSRPRDPGKKSPAPGPWGLPQGTLPRLPGREGRGQWQSWAWPGLTARSSTGLAVFIRNLGTMRSPQRWSDARAGKCRAAYLSPSAHGHKAWP